jgi:hypothetical protein
MDEFHISRWLILIIVVAKLGVFIQNVNTSEVSMATANMEMVQTYTISKIAKRIADHFWTRRACQETS